MLANHSHERLIALGLTGMAKAWDDQQQQPDADVLTFEQRLGLMIDREVTERENRRAHHSPEVRLVTTDRHRRRYRSAYPARHRSRVFCQAGRWRLDRPQAQPPHHRT